MATLTQSQLLNRTLEVMEDDLRIPKKNAKDFVDSLVSVIEETVNDGDKVSLFGIVNLVPTGVTAKPKRKATDPRTGEEKMLDAKPASVKVKASVLKRIKDVAPLPTDKAGKRLVAEAKERARKAAERAAAREEQAEKDAKKAAKSTGKKGKK